MSSSRALCCLPSEQGQAKVQHKPPILDDDLKKTLRKRRFQFRPLQDASEQSVLRNYAVFFADVVVKIYDN